MKKFIQKLALIGTAICLCVTMLVPTAFAESTSQSGAAASTTNYVLSFRPGAYGAFSDAAASYLSSFGAVQSSAAGNLFLQVAAGTALPSDLETQLRSYLVPEAGYYYRSGFDAAGTSATQDATYVADYGILQGNGIAYTVTYVDSTSGGEVAQSYTGYANSGDVITFAAKNVDGYTVDQASKSLTIGSGVDMTIVFNYTANTVPGTTTTNTVTQVVPGTITTVTGDGTAAGETITDNETPEAAGDGTGDGETITDNETPQAAGDDTGEVIDDNETPQADGITDGAGQSGTSTVATVAVAGVCAALVVAAIAFFLLRRKA